MPCGRCSMGSAQRARMSIPPGIKTSSQMRSSYAMNGEESVPLAVAPVSFLAGALAGIGIFWLLFRRGR